MMRWTPIVQALVLAALSSATGPLSAVEALPLLLAKVEQGQADVNLYLVSEKLDGVRAFWDGQVLRTRKGNAIIRYILCECANAARNTKSFPGGQIPSLMVRKSHKKSSVAIAHKIIRIIYFMLSRHEPYRDPGVDYQAMSAQKTRHAGSRSQEDQQVANGKTCLSLIGNQLIFYILKMSGGICLSKILTHL